MSNRVVLLVLAALALAPLAGASGFPPPADAGRVVVGPTEVGFWVASWDPEVAFIARESLEPGANGTFWFGLPNVANASGSVRVAYVNLSAPGATPSVVNLSLTTIPNLSTIYVYESAAFLAPSEAGTLNYTFQVELHERDAEGNTTLLGNATGSGSLAIQTIEVPAPPGVPTSWIVAGAAVLVVGGAGVGVLLKRRADRARMNAAPRRSQAMREAELERRLERAKTKAPDEAVAIQQEIRAAETVREKRRELQILEARRADALKTIDLLRKRHEAGGLTKLQFDNMVAKKQADLERIEAEIAAMEAGDAAAAS